jgi:hypothetical protein
MTHQEIIDMARAEGLTFIPDANSPLVRIVQQAVQLEREACAQVCDRFAARTTEAQQGPSDSLSNVMLRQIAVLGHCECAAAIRAMGNA